MTFDKVCRQSSLRGAQRRSNLCTLRLPRPAQKAAGLAMTVLQSVLSIVIVMRGGSGYAAYEKDPVKATQSDAVAVTEELLTREGEPGPASPTIKMDDTSKFLVKKPYEKVEDRKSAIEERPAPWWERWFFWEKKEKSEEKVLEQGTASNDVTD